MSKTALASASQAFDIQRKGIIPLLIGIQILVLLPLWFYMPTWIVLATTAILGLRYISYRYQFKLPSWLIMLSVLGAFAGVYMYFRAISGREAGIGLISLMYAFKLLESKSYRDANMMLFISFFVMVTSFLFNESLWMGVYLFACVGAILSGLLVINSLDGVTSIKRFMGMSSLSLLQALPIMALLFVLFPRLPGPLWSMPSQNQGGTGIDDTMSPGSIGALHSFDDLAFRAQFLGDKPPESEMYWRGLVFSNFDGYVWREGVRAGMAPSSIPTASPRYDYRIQLEPNKRQWIFGLENIAQAPDGYQLFNDFTLRSANKIMQRTSYRTQSYAFDYSGLTLTEQQRAINLNVPSDGNERSYQWARQVRQNSSDDESYISAVLTHIREQEYYYTLLPEILEDEIIDSFWFGSREGFCEHYASAFVYMMRAAGIPARVVTGYMGGEYNPYGDYYMIRQSDAHAWTEVWLEGKGWLRVDPTAAIHPSRVEDELQSRMRQRDDWFQDFDSLTDLGLPEGFLDKLRLRWDAIQSFWNDTLMGYNRDMQFEWLRKLGIEKGQWRVLGYGLLVTLFLGATIFGISLLRHKPKLDPIAKAMRQFKAKLAKHGIDWSEHEGPVAILAQIKKQQPDIYGASQVIIKDYIRLRYRHNIEESDSLERKANHEWAGQIQQFQKRIARFD